MAATGFVYYKPLTITTVDAVETDYTTTITVDHAALVTASKSISTGTDYRIFYDSTGLFTGSEIELDRVLNNKDGVASVWNNSTTKLDFRIQVGIGASSSDSTHYRAYYGKPSPGTPPENKNNIYKYFDDYSSNTVANYGSPAGWSVSGGIFQAPIGTSYAVYQTPVGTDYQELQVKIKCSEGLTANNDQQGLGFRNTTAGDNVGLARWLDISSLDKWGLAAVSTESFSAADIGFDASQWHTYRLTAIGNIFTLYVDGSNKVTSTDAWGGIDHPYAKLYNYGAASQFDDFQLRLCVSSEPTIALGTEVGGNSVPATPTNTTPADNATGVSRNPTLVGSAFSDIDVGNTHEASQWQVATDSGVTAIVWDSGETTTNKTSCVINTTNGTFAGVLSGKTKLAPSTKYYWHVRYKDNNGGWSSYS